jgi:hypothetical protein
MSVKAKRIVHGVGRLEYATTAKELLQPDHPANDHFRRWLRDKQPTKRQAQKFLQKFPKYREIH